MARRFLSPSLVLPLALVAALAACGRDARLKQLTVGISGDSALKVMGGDKPRRTDPYLTQGKYIQVMYFVKPGRSDTADRKLSPLVLMDGKLTGWGWKYLDSLAGPAKLPVAPK